jgi:hypothetical protein
VSEAKRAFIPTIAVDFDGCIHSYDKGWCEGELYGTVVPGFFEWLFRVNDQFHVVVHSSRGGNAGHVKAMRAWLQDHYLRWREMQQRPGDYPVGHGLEIVAEKPPAWITIDDRCVRFDGHWDEMALRADALLAFKPWMTRKQGGSAA